MKSMPKSSGAVSVQDVVDTLINQMDEFGISYIYAFGNNEKQYRDKIAAVEKAKIFGE
jgi:delta-aminolevulinic acid dehydratase/porphobilinogen synthase